VAYEPVPFLILDQPEQLKAFTDPLRSRVLSILCEREATNQQVAGALGEPHARVLHHVRSLLDMGLIVLVDTRIKGGNVEKYYRAVARMFGLRPALPELRSGIVAAELELVRQEAVASWLTWPDQWLLAFEGRRARMTEARLREFYSRLNDLIAEYWGGPDAPIPRDPNGVDQRLFAILYRDPATPSPGDSTTEGGQEGAS
jgi:DNA-binding transcriptional ArsR family regulator